jgi:Universal stress protein family
MNVRDHFTKLVKPIGESTKEPPKTILAPIDLDGCEAEQLDYAIGLAEHYKANLWLLPVSKGLGIAADVRGLGSYVHNSWSHRTQVRLWDLVLGARERHYCTFPVCACGINHSEQIVRVAERLNADLIVVRQDGHGRAFAGLTQPEADAVLRHAKSPIIIATTNGQSPAVANLHLDTK